MKSSTLLSHYFRYSLIIFNEKCVVYFDVVMADN